MLSFLDVNPSKANTSIGGMSRPNESILPGFLRILLVPFAPMRLIHAVGQIPYGEVGHVEPGANEVYHTMFFQNIYHIGDTKSAQELEVFLRMPKERLRLGCGIQCTDTLHPLGPKNVPSCTLLHYDFCGLPS